MTQRHVRGEAHGRAKLTAFLVLAIVVEHYRDHKSFRQLARELGVCEKTVRNVIHGRTWQSLNLKSAAAKYGVKVSDYTGK